MLSGQKTLEVRGSPYKGKYYFGTKGQRCKHRISKTYNKSEV